jgi:hypothetical protein
MMEIPIYIISMFVCWGVGWWAYDTDEEAGMAIFGCAFIPLINTVILMLSIFCGLLAILAYPLVWLKEGKWKKYLRK